MKTTWNTRIAFIVSVLFECTSFTSEMTNVQTKASDVVVLPIFHMISHSIHTNYKRLCCIIRCRLYEMMYAPVLVVVSRWCDQSRSSSWVFIA
jgi:hypothetical protein